MNQNEVREATREAVDADEQISATLSGETVAAMSAQNQFRRVKALGEIKSADRWIEIGATRTILVHDYPTNIVARAQRANRAWADLPDFVAGTRRDIVALHSENLL